ncbi:hypothetical protein BCR33DRAFT_711323 [Rhizoclosmatium globosum]|uniref:Uncharacterized protein n=1 Tax=Rhizoclosmatium globosum TaxID=329046 RepID=A0A1Y2D0V1_9FUNG|nr:hypothetical protein BCR33DRAFT_711323 [Rhizoclosmatium globosum]|eukprot:ORY52908.1 hypothetical protein BCR33DRAFT_711323 [Rhizoclosmatium globosum]
MLAQPPAPLPIPIPVPTNANTRLLQQLYSAFPDAAIVALGGFMGVDEPDRDSVLQHVVDGMPDADALQNSFHEGFFYLPCPLMAEEDVNPLDLVNFRELVRRNNLNVRPVVARPLALFMDFLQPAPAPVQPPGLGFGLGANAGGPAQPPGLGLGLGANIGGPAQPPPPAPARDLVYEVAPRQGIPVNAYEVRSSKAKLVE